MKLFLIGATGWIGRQVLEVFREIPLDYEIFGITAHKNEKKLFEIFKRFKPRYAVITGKEKGKYREFFYGTKIINEIIDKCDVVLFACAGTSLAKHFLYALQKSKKILMANKEIIVSFGEIIPRKYFKKIFPLDSEHSSLFQLISKFKRIDIEKFVITASGGPFFRKRKSEKIKISDVLKHPVWRMGKKITIDSATMMNKALEVIEAHYLFGIPASRIEVMVHPQSIVHSLIFLKDGNIFANLFYPDMKYPILYALGFPERKSNNFKRINFKELTLNFYTLNKRENKPVELARFAIEKKNGYPAVLNSANEEAVNLFLKGKIEFREIIMLVEKVMEKYKPLKIRDFEDIYQIEEWARNKIRKIVG